jgi:NADPH:quinone reductase-like Zn-dependent oxidoreductase
MLEELVKLFAKHRIEPVVAKVFEFEQAKEAFELQLKQLEPGKIVVKT